MTGTDQKTQFEQGGVAFGPNVTGITKVLAGIERVGNKLPHPFYLFAIIAALVAVVSAFVAMTGATTTDPATGETLQVQSLLSGEGLVYALTSAIDNFVSFPPLGLIITVMLGIGLAERVGLLSVFMRGAVLAAPKQLVTIVVVVISIMGNLASDSAMVIIPPLAAVAFMVAGRHPLVGFGASYAAVTAGFSANVIPAGTDVLLSGISTSAAQIVDPEAVVTPVSNYFFMAASTIIIAVAITLTTGFVEKRLGTYEGDATADSEPLTTAERKGLRNTAIVLVLYIAVLVAAVLPAGSPLRGEEGAILRSPFMSSIPVFLMLLFLLAGVTFGITAKTLTNAKQVPEMMAESVKELVPFIVVIFTAAQAIAWFGWTNLGLVIASSGADFLETTNLNGVWGLLIFSLFVTIPGLLISSGSALWTLLAPIFVPMFMLAGVDPAATQAAFRITDSATNTLVPMNPMIPVVLGLMQRFAPKAGLGTLFSLILPFTLVIWAVWLVQFLVWGLLGLPVGPGHSIML
ncbi:AbgT family transporter [Brevibacterium samyangense]|uniref:p-aminobenzoyl-glutamate transporter n=1 Tax=Brevibacterium samyangense TaxID=366888 RepID=A0ABP5EWA9_9MICO